MFSSAFTYKTKIISLNNSSFSKTPFRNYELVLKVSHLYNCFFLEKNSKVYTSINWVLYLNLKKKTSTLRTILISLFLDRRKDKIIYFNKVDKSWKTSLSLYSPFLYKIEIKKNFVTQKWPQRIFINIWNKFPS